MIANLTSTQLRRAADIQDRIESLQSDLKRILGSAAPGAHGTAPGKRRRMSAAARAKISAAQKTRWAKQRGAGPKKSVAKPKRKMSAAVRKRLAELAKARWAKAKAAGRKAL